MRALVIYDSVHGNTERIAKAIGGALGEGATVSRVNETSSAITEKTDVIVIGSPTHGGRPTPEIQALIDRTSFQGVKVAVFDTRLEGRIIRAFGYAAPRMGDSLKTKGATLVVPPEGFIVKKTKGPLKEGEIERAATWARHVDLVP